MRIDKFYKVFQHCYNSFQMEKSSRLEELYYFRQQFYFILYQAYTLTQCKSVKANGKNILKNIKKNQKTNWKKMILQQKYENKYEQVILNEESQLTVT